MAKKLGKLGPVINGGAVIIDDGGKGGKRRSKPIQITSDYGLDGIATDNRRASLDNLDSTGATVIIQLADSSTPITFPWGDVDSFLIGRGIHKVEGVLTDKKLVVDVCEKADKPSGQKVYHLKDRGPISKVEVVVKGGELRWNGGASLKLILPKTDPRL